MYVSPVGRDLPDRWQALQGGEGWLLVNKDRPQNISAYLRTKQEYLTSTRSMYISLGIRRIPKVTSLQDELILDKGYAKYPSIFTKYISRDSRDSCLAVYQLPIWRI